MAPICIIPARGGSKRIPKKNIKVFAGKPIILYSIESASNSGIFSRVVVSTDDEGIARLAREAGAEVPFLRSGETSNDTAGIADVLLEVTEQLEYYQGLVCCLLATAPLVSHTDLVNSHQSISEHGEADALVSVVEYDYPIQRAFVADSAYVRMVDSDTYTMRSQDLIEHYHDAGQFYWISVAALQKHRRMFTDYTLAYQMDKNKVHDIDSLQDWEIAEFKYLHQNRTSPQ